MFDTLGDKLGNIFSKLKTRGVLTEEMIDAALREIRIALFEADVSLPVVKSFIERVKEEALGQKIVDSIAPSQQMIKIVSDMLVAILGEKTAEIKLTKKPTVILVAGLQGAGKTTFVAKLAHYFQTTLKKKALVASLDTTRPAAQEQLEVLASENDIQSMGINIDVSPLSLAKDACAKAKKEGFDVVLLDTAGRIAIDDALIKEIGDIKAKISPDEILLVADAMMGQDATNVAKIFDDALDLTGLVLTRIDGDARGGAALSMFETIKKPIKFLGVGEKVTDLEVFHPDRIASRILGMGDVVSLVEKAQSVVDQKDAEDLQKKMAKGQFTFDDMLSQIRQLKKMGGMKNMLKMIPGAKKLTEKVDMNKVNDKKVVHQEAIILSMTPKERTNPKIIGGGRKKRIAAGSGTSVVEINRLLKQFLQMQKMMKKLGKMDKKSLMRGGLKDLLPPGAGF